MSEVEYDLLLEAVQTAVAPAPEDDFRGPDSSAFICSPRAANDNGGSGRWCRFLRAGTPPADCSRLLRPLDNRRKPLIIWMEATTRIELVYTVLQTVA